MPYKICKNAWLLAIFLTLHSFTIAQSTYYPGKEWLRKPAADLRMNPRILDSAVQFALANENKVDTNLRAAILKAYANEPGYQVFGPVKSRGHAAGIILKNGYIVAQWGDVTRADMTFSVSKSFLSTLAVLALDRNLISAVDDPVRNYVKDEKFSDPHNAKITWRHLLTQSSDWSGCLFDFCDWADRPPAKGNIDDWKKRPLLEPGTVFEYNDVRVNLMAYALLQVWRRPLPTILREVIMDPIGASDSWHWHGYHNSWVDIDGVMMQSVSGGGHFGGGLFINSLDQARFGLLFLRNGKWQDKQLFSPQWIDKLHDGSGPEKSYGWMWWTNRTGDLPGLSPELYYANGFGGNYIVIDKEHDLVVVARWLDDTKLPQLLQMVTRACY